MGRPRETDPTVLALRLQRRIINFIPRAGCPVAWPQLCSSMWPCPQPAIRAALETLTAQGVIKHTTRRELFLPHVPTREIDRDYWELVGRTREITYGA